MKSFIETVQEELKRLNPDIDYVVSEACKEVDELPTTQPVPFTAPMVVIVPRTPDDQCNAKFVIDYDTLMRYAQSSQQSVPVAVDQVVAVEKCIKKEDCAVAIKKIDLESTSNEINNAPNDAIKENKLSGLLNITNTINELKEAGIPVLVY